MGVDVNVITGYGIIVDIDMYDKISKVIYDDAFSHESLDDFNDIMWDSEIKINTSYVSDLNIDIHRDGYESKSHVFISLSESTQSLLYMKTGGRGGYGSNLESKNIITSSDDTLTATKTKFDTFISNIQSRVDYCPDPDNMIYFYFN